jgi:16S rRNA (guanine527-N7)-methyltransferase
VLGVELSSAAVRDLVRFADILDIWSRKMNLLACGSSRQLADRHLLDSLAVAPLLPSSGTVVDLGSGAGFPGIPLAIIRPFQSFVLVDSRQRRGSFLSEVRRTLRLENVQVLVGRAEAPPSEYAHCATAVLSRAVWSDEALPDIAASWLERGGILLRMKADDAEVCKGDLTFERTVHYRIEDERPRAIDVLRADQLPELSA